MVEAKKYEIVKEELPSLYGEIEKKWDDLKKLQLDNTKHQQESLKKTEAVSRVLKECISELPLNDILDNTLKIILAENWLKLTHKGAIFLFDRENEVLRLVAWTDLDTELVKECASINIGQCLCGKAAKNRSSIYKDSIDHDHSIFFDGIDEHGHYCLSIVCNDELLGVLCLYLDAGHKQNEEEMQFLSDIVNVLASVIVRKREEDKRLVYKAVIEGSSDAIIFTCKNWIIEEVNEAFKHVTGFEEGDVIGRSFAILQNDMFDCYDEEFYRGMQVALSQAGEWRGDLKIRRKNGAFSIVYVSIKPIISKDEKNGLAWSLHDINMERQYADRLRKVSMQDPLTRAPNRLVLEQNMRLVISNNIRDKQMHALLLIDLDRFNKVNDTFGHAAGDDLLKQALARINGCVRDGDTVARLGGDEFAVLLVNIESRDNAERIACNIVRVINREFNIRECKANIGSSIGIAIFPEHGKSVSDLLNAADVALYYVKENGRNGCCVSSETLVLSSREKNTLEADLRKALKNGNQFILVYQPKVDLETGQFVGVEALVRWSHPEKGLISPNDFISVAENSGLIDALGEWVLTEACRQGHEWAKAGFNDIGIAVNLSSRQFKESDDLVHIVSGVLRKTGFNSKNLELEITESAAARNMESVVRQMSQLCALGVSFSLDDFGTGMSSLGYLRQFPIKVLKIDRSFVLSDDQSIIRAIVLMAYELGLKVVAEGVEKEEQIVWLKEIGCNMAQGYYCSRPVLPELIIKLLKKKPSPMQCTLGL